MNKYKLFIIICFFVISSFLPKVNATIKGYNLSGKIICLDSGHGGIDTGAKNKTIIEKNINLILTKELEKELISRGATVYLTRDGDYDLSTSSSSRKRSDLYNRAKLINDIDPDLYISLHLNSTTNSKWRGLQVFYTNKNESNILLAEEITNYLKSKMSNVRDKKQNNTYLMYNNIKSPGVLIEAGFISNPDDNYLLRNKDYQKKLVVLISDAIENYFKNNK